MIFVDSSILIDVFSADSAWARWSSEAIDRAQAQDDVAINDIVYAELSPGFNTADDLNDALEQIALLHVPLPKAALFLAGKAFQRYRNAGGTKANVLPDFFIGAHAIVTDSILLTRDTKRVRTYFPNVRLMSPQEDT